MTILVAVMLVLAMAFPAAAEEYGWTDYAMKLEGTMYTVVLPEDMEPVSTDEDGVSENLIGHAKLGNMSDTNGGMSIEVYYFEDGDLDTLMQETYDESMQELIAQYGKDGVYKRTDISDWSMVDMMDICGYTFAVIGSYSRQLYNDTVQYESTEIHVKGESFGRMVYLFLPAEKGVYVVGYYCTRNYLVNTGDLFYGTILDE